MSSATSVIVDVSTEDGGTTQTTSVVPVSPSSNAAPVTPSSSPDTSETEIEPSTTTTVVPASSTAVVTPSSSTARVTPSTSTGISVVLVTSVVTAGGSTFTQTSSSSSTSLIATSATAAAQGGGGGGLSTTARNAIIGACAGGGGAIILGFLIFFLLRYLRKRKSDYTPGADDIRWPEEQQDTGMLFAPAVRQTGGAGLGREASMRSTVAGSITTAGVPAYSHRQPTIPEMGYGEDFSDHSGAGLAAGAAGVGAGAAYYNHDEQNNRYSYQPQQQHPGFVEPQDRQEYTYPSGYEASIRSQPTGPLRSTNHSNFDDISHYGGR